MSEESASSSSGVGGRDGRTAALTLCCLVAVLLGSAAIPALVAPLDTDRTVGSEGPVSTEIGAALEDELGGNIVGAAFEDETRIGEITRYDDPADRVVFTVEADRPAYWRGATYDTYDTTGWIRTSDVEPPSDAIPGRAERSTLSQEIRFQERLDVVPAAARVDDVEGSVETSRQRGGGLAANGQTGAGDTVTVRSVRPVTDRDRLDAHGNWSYPDGIVEDYGSLSADVPDRVHDRTDAITADATDPHETAVAIEQWLRTNRNYSLENPPPKGDVADELLFERRAAHCAYFASTMAVMLRSEGVPARYVTGYTTGELNDSAYTVRERNAHAWVEVYYPGQGWVPFDPTPPGDRTDALDANTADAVEQPGFDPSGGAGSDAPGDDPQSDPEDSQNGTDPEDPTEPEDPDDPQNPDGPTDPDSPDDPTGPKRTIEVESNPTPGEPVTVTVTEDGSPAGGLEVTFNGEAVGTTDADGQVEAVVPYAETLEIAVKEAVDGSSAATASGSAPIGEAGTATTFAWRTALEDGSTGSDDAVTVDLPTEIELEATDQPLAAETTTLVASVGGSPVADATVRLDGDRVGRTGADGRIDVEFPATGNHTIGAERGAASGERAISVPAIELRVEAAPLAVPERGTVVRAESPQGPVESVPVVVDGERVGTTDANGTYVMHPSTSVRSTVALGSDGQLAATTVWPLPTVAGALGLASALLGGLGLLVRRSDAARRPDLDAALAHLANALVTGLVRASHGLDQLANGHGGALDRWHRALRAGAGSIAGLLGTLAGIPVVAARSLRRRISEPSTSGGATTGTPTPAPDDATAGTVDGDTGDRAATERVVRRTWYALVAALPVSRPETRTPAELAERATDAGFPERPVRALLEVFRSVTYGDADPAPEAVDELQGALDRPGEGED